MPGIVVLDVVLVLLPVGGEDDRMGLLVVP